MRWALALMALLAACRANDDAPAPAASSAVAATASAEAERDPRIVVENAGASPREVLEVALGDGEQRRLRIEAVVATEVDGEAQAPTTFVAEAALQVKAMGAGYRLSATFENILPGKDGERLPEAEALAGLEATTVVGPDGWVAPLMAERALPPPSAQLFASLDEAVRDLWAPLPRVPLGDGARWRSRAERRRGGALVTRTTRYRLEKREGAVAILGEVEERVVAGSYRDPALPQLTLIAQAGLAAGRHQVRFASAPLGIPQAVESSVAGDLRIALSPDGEAASPPRKVAITQLLQVGRED
ncbi:MAG: hypothetical protein R3B72_14705 [Polyangiaceae bacterium]